MSRDIFLHIVKTCEHVKEIKFERDSLDLEQGEPFSFKRAQWAALNKIYAQDIKEYKEYFALLDPLTRQMNLDEKAEYFDGLPDDSELKQNKGLISDEDFYVAANLKYIEDAFFFIMCDKCAEEVVAVYVISE